ncbi:MAG TPA: SBBP repeat-containing protein [Terriglobales bacterium]|nr:SBBP repeat-containing protein [Terriglobales bacterium]
MRLNCRMSATVWPRSRILLLFLALVSVATVTLGGFGRSAGKSLVRGSEVGSAPFFSISASDHPSLGAVYSHLPLAFEPNQGQSDPRVKFLARGGAYGLFLTADEAVLVLQNSPKSTPRSAKQTAVVRMALDGANSSAAAGTDPLPGNSNYFIGNDPAKWHRKIPQFARVHYQNVYPGIDLVYYGNQGRLEYDFEVSPGADPSAIALQFPDVEIALNAPGDLVLVSGGNQVRFEAPRIYQKIGREEKAVPGRFIQRGKNRVGFALGDYDRSQTLIIDPVLAYSTYLGGTGEEACSVIAPSVISPITIDGIASPPPGCPAVAVDSSGNIYIAGATTSTDFPNLTKSPTLNGPSDVFIAKINPTAPSGTSQLFYSTFLGGSGGETTAGVAVDSGFNVIVAGNTNSGNFPTNGVLAPFQATAVAGTHGFVSKLDASGSTLIYSTYLSGNGMDTITGLALDVRGKAYVTGTTTSTNTPITAPFPATLGAFQTSSLAAVQFFMSKVDPAISGFASLPYSTYFGGGTTGGASSVANGGGIAVDTSTNINNAFNVYFTGGTNFLNTGSSSHVTGGTGTDFPILNAYQVCLDTPVNPTTPCPTNVTATDIFLAKINPAASPGAQLLYSTYLGGTSNDVGYGVAVDSGTNAYLTGWTTSPDFNFTLPTSVTSVFQKCLDTPVNPATGSPCPTIAPPAPADAFVAKIGPPCTTTTTTCPQGTVPLLYFTYLGGSGTDVGLSVAVDSIQGAQVTGWTNSSGGASTAFPHPNNPIQSVLAGGTDAFVARIDTTATSTTALGHFGTYLGGTGNDAGTGIALDAQNQTYVGGETFSPSPSIFSSVNPFQSNLNGPSDAFIAKLGPKLGLKATETASPNPVGAGNQVSFVYTLTNNGDLTSGITFNDTFSSTGVTFVSANSSPGTCTTALAGSVTCFVGTLNGGASATVTVILIPTSSGSLSDGGQFTVSGVSIKPNPPAVATVNDFTITVAPTVATVPAGTPATYTVTAAPTGVPYPDTVTLSVSSTLPPGVMGSFQNNAGSIPNLDSGAQSRVLVLSTSLRVTTPASLWRKGGPLYAAWLPVLGLALTGVGIGRKTWRRRWLMGVLLGAFLTLTLFQTNCGSSAPTPTTTGTPAGTYTLTVSGSSGSVSHTQQISLVVQ